MATGGEAAGQIVQRIQGAYPGATYALVWRTPCVLEDVCKVGLG